MSDPKAKYETRESVNGNNRRVCMADGCYAAQTVESVWCESHLEFHLDTKPPDYRPRNRMVTMPAWPMTEEEPVDVEKSNMNSGDGECNGCGMWFHGLPGTALCDLCKARRRPTQSPQEFYEAVARRRQELADQMAADAAVEEWCKPMAEHVPYTGKPYRPDYYKPSRKNPRIDPSADVSDVVHAWDVKDHRVASAIERLLRAGKKPGESFLKDLHKSMEEIHRAIEFAQMEQGE